MGVNDVWFNFAKKFFCLAISTPVMPGVNTPEHAPDQLDTESTGECLLHQASLGADSRAGDQSHLIAMDCMLVNTRLKCVFLRPAQNESSNNVNDIHGDDSLFMAVETVREPGCVRLSGSALHRGVNRMNRVADCLEMRNAFQQRSTEEDIVSRLVGAALCFASHN